MAAINQPIGDSTTSSAAASLRRWIGRLTIAGLIIGLAALNVLTVLSEEVHSTMYSGLRAVLARVTSTSILERAIKNSPTVRRRQDSETATKVLQAEKAGIAASSKALQEKHAGLERAFRDLETKHGALTRVSATRTAAVQSFSERMARRAATNAVRNTSAAPAESIPILGTTIMVAVTALDVIDACNTIKELNELGSVFGTGPQNHTTVCGIHVPTQSEALAEATRNWKATYTAAAKSLNRAKTALVPTSLPSITTQDVKAAVCPLVNSPSGLCP